MAFYFALMNVSNANRDNSSKRRSSSLSRYHHHHTQQSIPRRNTIISHNVDASSRSYESLSSPIHRIRRKFHDAQKNTKQWNDNQEKKVTFEKKHAEVTVNHNNFSKSHAFLDEFEMKMKDVNYTKKDTVLQPEHIVTISYNVDNNENKEQNVRKKVLPMWKTSSSRNIADTRLFAKKMLPCSRHRERANEGYCHELSVCSDHVQQVHAESIIPITVQNVANELTEHKLLLSAPPRRRKFWKTVTLLRRRSTSDSYPKYIWSYFNPGFRFVEDEYHHAMGGNFSATNQTDENYNNLSSYIYSERLSLTENFRRIR